jgi:hypothetical protein
MMILDRPVVLGRSVREVAVLAIGVFGFTWGLLPAEIRAEAGTGYYGWQWSLWFGAAAVLLAIRLWPARALAIGACASSLAQWVCVSGLSEWPWICNIAAAPIVLLSSRDLAAKFEEAPSRHAWLPNPFATLPRADARRLRWCGYALGVLASVLCQMWCMGERAFPATPAVFASLGAAIAVLALGRAIVLLPIAALGGAVLVGVAPAAIGASTMRGGQCGAIEAAACAAAAFALSAPYAWRLVRRAFA